MEKPQLLNSELAEFVGILLGDGSIGIYKSRSGNRELIQYRVQITCNSVDDKDYIKYLENLFNHLFSIKPRKSFRDIKTCDLRTFGRSLVEFLTNNVGLELAPKKGRAIIPDRYLDNDLELDILRGYFDTDGSVVITNNNGTIYPRLEMKICPSPMKDQFINILKRRGFRFGVYTIINNEVRIQMNGRSQLEKWIKEIGFHNQKHLDKIKKLNDSGGWRPRMTVCTLF